MRYRVAGFIAALAVALFGFVQAAAQRGAPQGGAEVEAAAGRTARTLTLTTMPRSADGRPDLRGSWIAPPLYNSNILEEHPGGFGIRPGRSVVIDPPDGKIPYQPWALAQRDENRKSENAYLDNEGRCIFSGMPRIQLFSFDIEYAGNQILMFFDYVHTTRIIHMDRRTHLPSSVRLWMGDSLGYWDGDTLVVDTANFNGQAWFALGGDFATDALHIVERFRLSDPNTLQWEATLSDPKAFTRPWTWRWNEPYTRGAPNEMGEEACHEGNADIVHLKKTYDKSRADLAAGVVTARGVPTVTPKGPGRLTGEWVMTQAIGGGGNSGMLLHSNIVINHTSDQVEFLGTTSRQDPTYGVFKLDGTEIRMDAGAGITQTGRVSTEGDKIVVAIKRSFASPAGEIVVEIREAYSVSGDALILERAETVGGRTDNGKATYRRVP